MQKMVTRPSIWYLLHFNYIKPYPESQQSEKTHPSEAPRSTTKRGSENDRLEPPKCRPRATLRGKRELHTTKTSIKSSISEPQISPGHTARYTRKPWIRVVIYYKNTKQKLRIGDVFLFLHLCLFWARNWANRRMDITIGRRSGG